MTNLNADFKVRVFLNDIELNTSELSNITISNMTVNKIINDVVERVDSINEDDIEITA